MTTTLSGHIEVGDDGVARITRSRMKVIDLVMSKVANGLTPEQLREEFPLLSLAEIHAAFTFYYDHQADCDAQIEASAKFAAQMRAAAGPSPVAAQLRTAGKLP
jgi:uncharacterized protein (DUF433 family)